MENKTLKIGITGGIGSGKSLVCRAFSVLDAPIYYADDKAKWLMSNNDRLKKNIKSLFGDQAYLEDGQLHRAYIGKMIFSNPKKLAELNALVHPAVHADVEKWFSQQTQPYAIEEAALIIESGNSYAFDKIILVTAPVEIRISRVMRRNKISREEVLKRIQNQTTDQYKRKFADIEIVNDGKHSIVDQIWYIHQQIIS